MGQREGIRETTGARRAALRRAFFGAAGRMMERLPRRAGISGLRTRPRAARAIFPSAAPMGWPCPRRICRSSWPARRPLRGEEPMRRRSARSCGAPAAISASAVRCSTSASAAGASRGTGRASGPEFHACDYNELLVRWCQENLPFLRTAKKSWSRRSAIEDGAFELVYAYSVFTHCRSRCSIVG